MIIEKRIRGQNHIMSNGRDMPLKYLFEYILFNLF
jgi:hypothetical protein